MPRGKNVDPEATAIRARLAIHSRWHPEDTETIAEMRAELDKVLLRKLLRKSTLFADEAVAVVKEVLTQ
jgi:hypothetical protein